MSYICKYCGKKLQKLNGLSLHENHCRYNPNRKKHGGYKKSDIEHFSFRDGTILDITYIDLEEYRKNQLTCEICGRTADEAIKYNGKFSSKKLCVDHDHNTNKFRGLLCQQCNRQLGWYENNREAIIKYLNKAH